MEENQTSESVAVLPDIAEPLASETEAVLTSEHEAHPVAVTASVTSVAGISGVPVSLPVGSIVASANGTTFNVITSQQLHEVGLLFFSPFRAPSLELSTTELIFCDMIIVRIVRERTVLIVYAFLCACVVSLFYNNFLHYLFIL